MDYLRIGLIARPHGVHGALKLIPLSEDLNRYRMLKDAFLERNGSYEAVGVSDVSVQPDAVFLKVSGCNSREDAETLRNVYLCVDRAHAVKLPEGRYFISDLIGCSVCDTHGCEYGTLTDVLETGSADVYVVKGKRELMFPALKKLLFQVDIKNKRIMLDADVLLEVGLFED